MTLADLLEQAFTEQWFAPSRERPMKSAVGHYAELLGYKSPTTCPVESAIRPQATIQHLIETHAKPGLLPESIANQWRSIWNLITEAAAHGVIPAMPQTDEYEWRDRGQLRRDSAASPDGQSSRVHQHRWDGLSLGKFGLTDWPIDLAQETYNYVAWCQKPLARGRPARIQKVDSTATNVYITVGQVAGYAVQQRGIPKESLTLMVLCEPSLLEDFCWWWIESRRQLSTETIRSKLGIIHTIARHWLKDAEHTAGITDIFRRLDEEAPAVKVVDKRQRWLPLETLDRIARSTNPRSEARLQFNKNARYIDQHISDPIGHPLPPCWQPGYITKRGGKGGTGKGGTGGTFRFLAVWAGVELIIRLLIHRPLRIGNICQLQFRHLQMRHGELHIVIPRAELKNAKYFPEAEWDERFPKRLQERFDDYQKIWRPRLARAESPYVFLNRNGNPYIPTLLTNLIGKTTWRYTQDRDGGPVAIPAHRIRTIWTSEMLHAGLNLLVVRRILGDSLKVLEKHYTQYERRPPSEFALTLAKEIQDGID
jgi:integrase